MGEAWKPVLEMWSAAVWAEARVVLLLQAALPWGLQWVQLLVPVWAALWVHATAAAWAKLLPRRLENGWVHVMVPALVHL
jgi:hypothetical protein